jgi:hypothetical protein
VTPVAETGVEGSAIALNLGVTVNSETGPNGDAIGTNTLSSLVISNIPVYALLNRWTGRFLPGGTWQDFRLCRDLELVDTKDYSAVFLRRAITKNSERNQTGKQHRPSGRQRGLGESEVAWKILTVVRVN